jgi:hypothetical protein
LTLDGVTSAHEKRPVVKPIRIGARTIEPGSLMALCFEVRGIVAGRAPIVVECDAARRRPRTGLLQPRPVDCLDAVLPRA